MTARTFGLIPAAGSGSRFEPGVPKQYARIAGKPMLQHAVASLLAAAEVRLVFVVLAPDDQQFRRCDWTAFGSRVAPLYCGGAARRDSVLNGLVACASAVEPEDWMLVHDAARPCLDAQALRGLLLEGTADEVGAVLAVPVADTLKRADDQNRIAATEPREGLWQAQTPQLFRHGLLLRALREAPLATDESQAVESLGYRPRLVRGSARNFKVTWPGDLQIAARLLEAP